MDSLPAKWSSPKIPSSAGLLAENQNKQMPGGVGPRFGLAPKKPLRPDGRTTRRGAWLLTGAALQLWGLGPKRRSPKTPTAERTGRFFWCPLQELGKPGGLDWVGRFLLPQKLFTFGGLIRNTISLVAKMKVLRSKQNAATFLCGLHCLHLRFREPPPSRKSGVDAEENPSSNLDTMKAKP